MTDYVLISDECRMAWNLLLPESKCTESKTV